MMIDIVTKQQFLHLEQRIDAESDQDFQTSLYKDYAYLLFQTVWQPTIHVMKGKAIISFTRIERSL